MRLTCSALICVSSYSLTQRLPSSVGKATRFVLFGAKDCGAVAALPWPLTVRVGNKEASVARYFARKHTRTRTFARRMVCACCNNYSVLLSFDADGSRGSTSESMRWSSHSWHADRQRISPSIGGCAAAVTPLMVRSTPVCSLLPRWQIIVRCCLLHTIGLGKVVRARWRDFQPGTCPCVSAVLLREADALRVCFRRAALYATAPRTHGRTHIHMYIRTCSPPSVQRLSVLPPPPPPPPQLRRGH